MAAIPIQAVVFDMGGTLEEVYYDDGIRLEAACGLQRLLHGLGLDPGLSVPDLKAAVLEGMARYCAGRGEEGGARPGDTGPEAGSACRQARLGEHR